MDVLNIEWKARCADTDRARRALEALPARFAGLDRQLDTYFVVPRGRLKLREGAIERALIFYERSDEPGRRASRVVLAPAPDGEPLREALTAALGILVQVRKEREIWYAGNVKIHLDTVAGLGAFVEVEALQERPDLTVDDLQRQCDDFALLFGVTEFIGQSYSDLLLEAGDDCPAERP
jgi:adenylate cyclase, class 2